MIEFSSDIQPSEAGWIWKSRERNLGMFPPQPHPVVVLLTTHWVLSAEIPMQMQIEFHYLCRMHFSFVSVFMGYRIMAIVLFGLSDLSHGQENLS